MIHDSICMHMYSICIYIYIYVHIHMYVCVWHVVSRYFEVVFHIVAGFFAPLGVQTLVEMDTGGDAFLKQVVDVYLPFGSNRQGHWQGPPCWCLGSMLAVPRLSVPNEVGKSSLHSKVWGIKWSAVCWNFDKLQHKSPVCKADAPKMLQETCPVIPDLTRLGLPWNAS